LMGVTL